MPRIGQATSAGESAAVEERLEKMVVPLIDDCDVDGAFRKALGRGEAAEARADDHGAGTRALRGHLFHGLTSVRPFECRRRSIDASIASSRRAGTRLQSDANIGRRQFCGDDSRAPPAPY